MPTSTRRDALLFTGISGKFGTAQGGRQSRRPLQKVFDRFPYPVGADDSVRPAEYADFSVIFGKFGTSKRADVGIGPYGVLYKLTAAHRAEQSLASTESRAAVGTQ